MKKHLFSILLLTLSISAYAQVKTGIGTKDPKQVLHVAGTSNNPGTDIGSTGVKLVTPTVRIEGLNSVNNPANPADSHSLKRVYANQNGDLVLVNSNLEQQVFIQKIGDAIPTNSKTASGANALESVVLRTDTLTLKNPSVVYFSATFQATLKESVSGSIVPINDGRAKLFGAYFQFSAAPANVSAATFGNNKKTYANIGYTSAATDFMLNPRAKLVLPSGTYIVKLYGELLSTGIGNRFNVTFGGGTTGENLLINATPIQHQ